MCAGGEADRKALPFGIDAVDRWLPGGGLVLGAVHEICEQGTDAARASLSALFAAAILARLPGPVIWCLHSRDLFAPALARVGLHPDRVIYCETWKDSEVLPAMEEGLRHGGLAGVVGELVRLPLTPSRRLQLAAEASGVVAFVLRRSGAKADENNACFSRWRLSSSPSGPMSDFDMGRACWQLELLRCRGAEANTWTVEAPDAKGHLAIPADLGDRSPAPAEWRLATA
nr:damage-inducible mutagenesis protein [Bradyrhizobium sp. WSM1417]